MLTVFVRGYFKVMVQETQREVLLWPFVVYRGRPWTMTVNPGSTTRLKYVNSQALISSRLTLERTSI